MQWGRYSKPEKNNIKENRGRSIVTDVQMAIWDWHKLNSKRNKGSGDEFSG